MWPPHDRVAGLAGLVLVAACGGDPLAGRTDPPAQAPMEVGETRRIELWFLRLDVDGFERTLTLDDLRAIPRGVLEQIWVLDLDLRPLTENALRRLRDMPEEEAANLSPAARNMRRLLTMTPDDADLSGTGMAELIGLSASVGIPPAKALSALLGVGVTEPILPVEDVAGPFVDLLVGSHPAARFRPGPVDADHPDGLWPVAPGAIPITLDDVAFDFVTLPEKLGPAGDHPGIVADAQGVLVVEEDFRFTVRVRAQALPYKGVDLRTVEEATVNSKPGQIATLFDFDDPDWMRIEGLVETPRIERLDLKVVEADTFVPGGDARDPAPTGNSSAWDLAPYLFERILVETGYRWAPKVPKDCDTYTLGTGTVAFEACVAEDGWTELTTFADVGDPPAPAYLWDLLLEIGQVRLHDGGLAEGEADIEAAVRDVPVGYSGVELADRIRAAAAEHPEGLRELVRAITENSRGEADFFYVRTVPGAPADLAGDYLYFIHADDLPRNEEGQPVRDPEAYARPGFYADPDLSQKVSSGIEVEGDRVHEKVRIAPGDVLYVQDDAGWVFRLDVREKPSTWRIALDVTRIR